MQLIILLLYLVFTGTAFAHVTVNGTRLVYKERLKQADLVLENLSDVTSNLKVWLDEGNLKTSPDDAIVPFFVYPPVSKLKPGKQQTLRFVYSGKSLPKDRESLYYINILDSPAPVSGSADSITLQFAVRTRLKLFYRPEGLAGTPDSSAQSLTWKLSSNGTYDYLEVFNTSGYCVSVAQVRLLADSEVLTTFDGSTVLPFASSKFQVDGSSLSAVKRASIVEFDYVDDFGGYRTIKGVLSSK